MLFRGVLFLEITLTLIQTRCPNRIASTRENQGVRSALVGALTPVYETSTTVLNLKYYQRLIKKKQRKKHLFIQDQIVKLITPSLCEFILVLMLWFAYKKNIGWLVGFYSISTIVGYLKPNPFLNKLSVLFQTIQFSMSTQFNYQKHFYFKQLSITGTSPSDCLVSYPGHSLEDILPLCKGAVGVFYSPSRLGFWKT